MEPCDPTSDGDDIVIGARKESLTDSNGKALDSWSRALIVYRRDLILATVSGLIEPPQIADSQQGPKLVCEEFRPVQTM